MNKLRHIFCFCGFILLVACSEEPRPVSVIELMDNPRLLEATIVRCAENRSESRHLAECLNVREAVNRLNAAQEKTSREDLEKQSERKRQALRRSQEAAAEAHRRAAEEQRRREEEEYLGIFEEVSGGAGGAAMQDIVAQPSNNAPTVEIEARPEVSDDVSDAAGMSPEGAAALPSDNAPTVEIEAPPEIEITDDPSDAADVSSESGMNLDDVREELERRQETPE